jgi:drug/metabolite transporter (DMT)-like permease
MTPFDWALLLLLSLLWGGSFFFAEIALRGFQPFTMVFARVALASVALLLFIKLRGGALPKAPAVWRAFFIMGLLNNLIPFSLIFYGQTQIGAGLASILNATTPVFTVIVAHFLTTDERMTPAKIAGAAFGFTGVAVLLGADALAGLSLSALAMVGALGAALAYAFAAIYGRRFKEMKVEPTCVAFGQVTATALMTAPIALMVDAPFAAPMPGAGAWSALIALGLLSTALAYVLYFRVLSSGGATNLSLVTFLIPPSSVMLGVAFLGERLAPSHIAGMALIALGLAAIDGRAWRALRRARDGRATS